MSVFALAEDVSTAEMIASQSALAPLTPPDRHVPVLLEMRAW